MPAIDTSKVDIYEPCDVDKIWVCSACGKTARTKSGQFRDGAKSYYDEGWDTSCMTWAVLCHINKEEGAPWQAVQAPVDPVHGTKIPCDCQPLMAGCKQKDKHY